MYNMDFIYNIVKFTINKNFNNELIHIPRVAESKPLIPKISNTTYNGLDCGVKSPPYTKSNTLLKPSGYIFNTTLNPYSKSPGLTVKK
jgi:hypothetical protein